MTEPSEVDPVVLAGEPDSVHVLEGGDDDLPVLGSGGAPGPDTGEELPALRTDGPSPDPDEWAAADALLEGQPTALGEQPPRP